MKTLLVVTVALLPITSIVAGDAPPKNPAPYAGSYTWNSGQYTYDALGNIVAIGGDTYGYDANNRLTGATIKGPDGTQTFSRTSPTTSSEISPRRAAAASMPPSVSTPRRTT